MQFIHICARFKTCYMLSGHPSHNGNWNPWFMGISMLFADSSPSLVWVYNPTLDSTLAWTGQLNDTAPGYSWPWRINDNMTTSLTMGDTHQ
jgi:hypothetical protein